MGIFICSCCYENIYKCKGHSIAEIDFSNWIQSKLDIWANGSWKRSQLTHIGKVKICVSCEKEIKSDCFKNEGDYYCEPCYEHWSWKGREA